MEHKTEDRLRIVEQQINTHEAVCAERYAGILSSSNQMRRDFNNLTKTLITVGLALIAGIATILSKLISS